MVSNALKALLGVVAVAGYQNRDKIAEVLRGMRNTGQAGVDGPQSGGLGGLLGGLTGGNLGGIGGLLSDGAGGTLSGGLSDLLKRFEDRGYSETAKSWIDPGPNKEIDDQQLLEALGPEILDDLSMRTGLPPEEILKRLSKDLPTAVDDLTPDGSIPEDEDGEPGSRGRPSVPSVKSQIV